MNRQEAIQIIKNNWPNGCHMLSEALEFLIPELKALVARAKSDTASNITGKDAEMMLDCLEKQGKQKPIKEHNVCDFCEERYGCVNPCPTKLIEEEKPAKCDKDRSKELSLSFQIQAYLNTASDELYAKGKPLYSKESLEDIHKCMLMWQKLHNAYFYQKPAECREEDEKNYNTILRIIRDSDVSAQSANRLASWLKLNIIQSKQEWSEEDEMIECLNNCLDELEEKNGWNYIYINNKDVELNKVRNWLKSFKHRMK